ncbi:MAG: NAD(P) transhydrogenase subunit alpha [Anaeromyxobacter sp.]
MGERRVALVPENVARLSKAKNEVRVERGAGAAAGFSDEAYQAAGATVTGAAEALDGAEVVAMVQRPSEAQAQALPAGAVLVALLAPHGARPLLDQLAGRGVHAMAMEKVPRTTRAQSMDALSSQATLAGYRAVLLGAGALPRILPMMTTAAGTLAPAKAFIIGAGVAGLQAIATARRLGAVVSAFDVRPVVKEQCQSLGAAFLEVPAVAAEGSGGYARELGQDEQARVLATIAGHIKDQDLVITTAAIPGRAAPRLITAEMVRAMRPGSVIVDLAAETGGNCELTRAGETVVEHGVSILGVTNLPSTLPFHASQMYGRNIVTLLTHLGGKEGVLSLDPGGGDRRRHAGGPRREGPALAMSIQLIQIYVFILAGFVGFFTITRVPALLHTPLMSATNAISAISVVGALALAGGDQYSTLANALGAVAVASATLNVVGGFIITDRMLKMFKHAPRKTGGDK